MNVYFSIQELHRVVNFPVERPKKPSQITALIRYVVLAVELRKSITAEELQKFKQDSRVIVKRFDSEPEIQALCKEVEKLRLHEV